MGRETDDDIAVCGDKLNEDERGANIIVSVYIWEVVYQP